MRSQFRITIGGCLKTSVVLVVVLTSLTASVRHATAQQITASIVGTVKDPQGAIVPGANVIVTNIDTGVSQSTVTNTDGLYSLEHLSVGRYIVGVKSKGFKEFVQRNIVLTIEQKLVLNAVLEVGSQAQSVTVTTAPSLLNTTTAVLGRTVEPGESIELPLVNLNAPTANLASSIDGKITSANTPRLIQIGARLIF